MLTHPVDLWETDHLHSSQQLLGGLRTGAWNFMKITYPHGRFLGWKHPNLWGRKSGVPEASLSSLYGLPSMAGSAQLGLFYSGFQRSTSSGSEREPGAGWAGEPYCLTIQTKKPQNVTLILLYLLKEKYYAAHSQG